jgi:spermidine/putrescine transport system permease protein
VLLCVLAPAGILFVYSFYSYDLFQIYPGFHFHWYHQVFSNAIYRTVAWNTVAIALPTTVASIAGGYAIAYYVVFCATRARRLILALVVISMLSSYLARVYAWRTLLGENGIINTGLQWAGAIHGPISWLLFSRLAVILAEVSLYLPIAALILFASLSGVQPELRDVARDLGAGRAETLWRVTLPLSGRALFGAALLTFFLSCGDYITPAFLGGASSSQTFGTTIASAISIEANYPLGAALSFVMVAGFLVYGLGLLGALRFGRLLPRTA